MNKVSMYTLSTCPWCRKTKQFFRDRGISFDFIDYDLASQDVQQKITNEMTKQAGPIAFPFVKVGDTVVVGYNPERYEQLLKSNEIGPTMR